MSGIIDSVPLQAVSARKQKFSYTVIYFFVKPLIKPRHIWPLYNDYIFYIKFGN